MKILFLCEGDAETWDAWSGSARSIVEGLRAAGHMVQTGDVDLYGADRLLGALGCFAPSLPRWRVRYRFQAEGPFRRRSRRAERHIQRSAPGAEAILQIGATFEPRGRGTIPYALFCDSNIAMARRGARAGHSTAARLSDAELDRVTERERRVYGDASLIFTLSEELRRSFIADFGLPAERVVTVHGGPNLDAEALGTAATRQANPHPTVLFVGRRFHRKGGDVLLEAFRSVRERVPTARLLVAGPPEPLEESEGVEWLGDLDKRALARTYQAAHVFCLPTRFEPYGIAFLEAMWFGLPCVGTDAWAVPEMIAEGETGYLVPVDDPGTLCDRLVRLLGDPIAARRMGEAGRERARSFTWEAAAARMSRALRERLARATG